MTVGFGAAGMFTPLVIGDVLGALDSVGLPVPQLLQMADNIAFIALAAIGLTIIFGMMGVINLAHGEFIMMGAYITTLSVNVASIPLPIAMLLGGLGTAVFGAIVERTIVRRLYGRLLDSMIVTFGLGLILTQGTRIIFGNSLQSIGTPFGQVPGYTYSGYRVLLLFAAIAVLGAVYLVFTHTEFGVQARATIQDPETAQAMGVDTDRMYTITFAIGSGLAGLTGALYAPSATIVPGMGQSFLVESFVTVVTGGSSVLLGTALAGSILGTINAIFSNLYGNFIGQIALLITAIMVIRLLPDGLTGLANTIREKLGERQ